MNETDVPEISVIRERCAGDGLCSTICPVRIFECDSAGGGPPRVLHAEECCACGQCVAACPRGAIVHPCFAPASVSAAAVATAALSREGALALLSTRRSVRMYRKEVPPRSLLASVVEAAAFAPGSPNRRVGWIRNFVVVSGDESMRRVREMTVDYVRRSHRLVTSWWVRAAARFDAKAQAAQTIAPDLAMRLREWDAGRDAITYDAPAAIFAHAPCNSSTPQVDCDAALYAVLLMAHAHGLGACWNGLLQSAAAGDHLRGFTKLHELLGIPAGHRCYAAATVGYPAVKYHGVPQRPVSITWVGE